ncbi:MAG: thiamine-binding protein, partial [Desulfobulbaceae bacterium]|nr:thiamine-binding protein [Desulfobulbaceae bacterium]
NITGTHETNLKQQDATEVLAVMEKIHELPFLKGAQRVVTQITMDDRRDKKVSIGDKVAAVKTLLGENE